MTNARHLPQTGWRRWIGDASGAFGDLGVFLPLMIGLLIVGAYDASGLLVSFGIFAIATGLIYRRPVPVQPMKVIAALAITGAMTAADVMASGIVIGVVLLVLGLTGLVSRFQRLTPRTILLGVQIGLGAQLILKSADLAGDDLWFGALLLLALMVFQLAINRVGACLVLTGGAVIWGMATGSAALPETPFALHWPNVDFPGIAAFWRAAETGVLPQLALTITNAILLTVAISGDYFPQDRNRISARNLALSSGGLNLLLAPLGAVPMCHGAGGLAAQYGQGARTGLAPVIFGSVCIAFGVMAGPHALAWLLLVPMPVIAALLAYAGCQLLNVQRLGHLRPACLTIIAATAVTSVLVNVVAGLAIGCLAEFLRSRLLRRREALQPARGQ
ncbi:MAG: putative sulfate/molybdate transporter [Hyphomicrobiales bacterium]|nr:putative sulfate/molybdate transporter [Hyphomicrobiales bacterium]